MRRRQCRILQYTGHNARTFRRQAQQAATPTLAAPPSALTASASKTAYSEALYCKVQRCIK